MYGIPQFGTNRTCTEHMNICLTLPYPYIGCSDSQFVPPIGKTKVYTPTGHFHVKVLFQTRRIGTGTEKKEMILSACNAKRAVSFIEECHNYDKVHHLMRCVLKTIIPQINRYQPLISAVLLVVLFITQFSFTIHDALDSAVAARPSGFEKGSKSVHRKANVFSKKTNAIKFQ